FGVAETTIAFMLSLLKKVAERDTDVRAGKWRTADNFAYYVGSRASDGFPGQTIGIVGLGRIGTRVAQLLAPWRARIIAYDPYVPPAHFLTHGVTPADSPLRKLGDRVLLSPHSAYYTEGGELRQGVAWATRSVVTALKGGIPDNVYNREVIPRWKERFGGASAAGARGRLGGSFRPKISDVSRLRPAARIA